MADDLPPDSIIPFLESLSPSERSVFYEMYPQYRIPATPVFQENECKVIINQEKRAKILLKKDKKYMNSIPKDLKNVAPQQLYFIEGSVSTKGLRTFFESSAASSNGEQVLYSYRIFFPAIETFDDVAKKLTGFGLRELHLTITEAENTLGLVNGGSLFNTDSKRASISAADVENLEKYKKIRNFAFDKAVERFMILSNEWNQQIREEMVSQTETYTLSKKQVTDFITRVRNKSRTEIVCSLE